ncbi:MAG: RsmG family class I SAM-dependent methyltransferase [Desulfovibrionaceae bacterium]
MSEHDDITKSFFNSPHGVPVDEVSELCTRVGCTLNPHAVKQLATYLELLMQWNKVMNLVGAHTWQSAVLRLVADSFFLATFLDTLPLSPSAGRTGLHTWDLGAGAGLPGIPLRMVWDKGDYCLVEAREKRAVFLSTVLARIALPRTKVFRGRAEAFFSRQAHGADVIVSRAFLPWEQVLALVEPVLAPQGMVVFLASDPAPQELPVGFQVHAQYDYTIAARPRWFWAFTRSSHV